MAIIRSPSNCRCSLWFPYECGGGRVLNRPRLRTRPPLHSYGNQMLQRQFDGLLMMGIIMSETCWAVSVRQSNKILRLIVASSWVFYLNSITSSELCWFDLLIACWTATCQSYNSFYAVPALAAAGQRYSSDIGITTGMNHLNTGDAHCVVRTRDQNTLPAAKYCLFSIYICTD